MSEEKKPLWQDIKSFPRRVASWGKRGIGGWFFLLGIVVACGMIGLIMCRFGTGGVRFVAWALQIAGVSTIALNLSGITKKARTPSLQQRLVAHLGEFPRLRTKSNTVQLTAQELGSDSASAQLRMHSPQNASMEERLRALEDKIYTLHDEISRLENKQRDNNGQLWNEIGAVRKKLNNKITELDNLINGLVVDGLDVEWIGVFLFLFGITLGAFPEEIYDSISMNICTNGLL